MQLVRDLPRESRGQTEVGIAFQNEVEYVDVVVRAPGFEEVSGYGAGSREGPALRRTIAVPRDGDSQPAVFLFQLVDDRTGPHWVTVDFYHRGRNAGSLTLEVAVRSFPFLRGGTRRGEGIDVEEGEEPAAFGTASVVRAVDGVAFRRARRFLQPTSNCESPEMPTAEHFISIYIRRSFLPWMGAAWAR